MLAKEAFRIKGPDRQRTPRNFLNSISIELTGIEAGSTIPQIKVVSKRPDELFLDSEQVIGYLKQGREMLIQIVESSCK